VREGRGSTKGVQVPQDFDLDQQQGQRQQHEKHVQQQNLHRQQQEQQQQQQRKEKAGRLVTLRARVLSTAWMVPAFALVVYQGPLAVWGLVLCLQALIAGELFALGPRCIDAQFDRAAAPARRETDAHSGECTEPAAGQPQGPGGRRSAGVPSLLNWHWAFTAAVFMYGRLLQPQIVASAAAPWAAAIPGFSALLLAFVRYHAFLSFSLYFAGTPPAPPACHPLACSAIQYSDPLSVSGYIC